MIHILKICIFCSLSRFLIALSLLSDQTNGSMSRTFVTDGDSKESDTFRHLLNQESIIRMSLTNTVQTLMSNVQSLMKDVLTLKESTGSRISQLEAEVENVQTENQRLDSELQKTKAKEGNLSSLVASFQVSLSNVSILRGKTKKVGFSASVSSSSSSWNSGTLVFPSIITNEGNGYNPNTGIFTAPVGGLYVFFVNVQSYNTNGIYVNIVLNGSTKVRTMAYGTSNDRYNAGPNLVVLNIQKGDAVWVKYYSGSGYYHNGPITTFSGFLIHM